MSGSVLSISQLPAASALAAGDLIALSQGSTTPGTGTTRKGTVTQMIAAVSAGSAVGSIAALRAATTTTYPQGLLYVEGYSALCDGGEGVFIYQPADTTSADNGGTLILDASGRRWYRAGVDKSEFNVLWFGGNTASDFAPILSAILAYITSISSTIGGAKIYFPPLKYYFLSGVAWSYPAGVDKFSLTLCGAGADVSVLCWTGGTTALALQQTTNHHGVHVWDLSFTTTQNGVSVGLSLASTSPLSAFVQNDVSRCTFRGDSLDASAEWWSVGLNIYGVTNIDYDGDLFVSYSAQGVGVWLEGNAFASPYYTIVHNFTSCGFFGVGTGILHGAYVQGVTIAQSNFTNGVTGIRCPTGTDSSIAQLAVIASQFNCTGNQIQLDGGGGGLYVADSVFYIPTGQIGISFPTNTGNQALITGNSFDGPGGQAGTPGGIGISVPVHFDYGIVTSNAFEGLTDGVVLSGCAGWNVQGNGYRNCTTQVVPGTGNSVGVATN